MVSLQKSAVTPALDPLLPSLYVEPLSAEEASRGACYAEARLLCFLGPTGRPSLLLVLPLPCQHVVPLPLPACLDPAVRLESQLRIHLPSGLSQKPWAVHSGPVLWDCGFNPCFLESGGPLHGLRSNHSVGEAAQRDSAPAGPLPHVFQSTKVCGWATSLQYLRKRERKEERERNRI